jgi:hypothetical protein
MSRRFCAGLFWVSFAFGADLAFTRAVSANDCRSQYESLLHAAVQSARPRISTQQLQSGIVAHRGKVAEFEFIKKEAEKRGLRVWLFGGTAASYSHYVNWDLLREAGDQALQGQRFDYDYTNIFRSTQDLDIVVDGNSQVASEFQNALMHKFPHFLGSKANQWEVRSLKEAHRDKGALLHDFGFMNQHTDSNSTGMVELTDPPPGEAVVRDLRDWKSPGHSQFFRDVHEGKITYYHSPTHGQTARAKSGQNPEIFSVVRYLTKAFQYELKMRDEDLAQIKKIIDEFDPRRDLANADAARWMERNGKKLLILVSYSAPE